MSEKYIAVSKSSLANITNKQFQTIPDLKSWLKTGLRINETANNYSI